MPKEKPKIADAWVFPSGTVITFDQHGAIMPYYTGSWNPLEIGIRAHIKHTQNMTAAIHRGDITGKHWQGYDKIPGFYLFEVEAIEHVRRERIRQAN